VQILRRAWDVRAGLSRAWLIPVLLALFVAWRGPATLLLWFDTSSTLHWRFAVWRDALRVIRDFPIVGTGLNTFGRVMLVYQKSAENVQVQQAYSDYLQLAAEGGLLVLVPAAIAVWLAVREIRRRFAEAGVSETTYWIRVGAVAALCGIAVQETVEFSLQMPGNAALFAVICGIALHRAPVRERDTTPAGIARLRQLAAANPSHRQLTAT
jgi:O-antigen ligase